MTAIERLKRALSKANEHGLRVIITMTDLPGSKFHSRSEGSSFPFWESPLYRSRAAKFWGLMAEAFADSSNIIAYDLINEPYTPEDKNHAFFDDNVSLAYVDKLHQFYKEAHCEVRKYDKHMPIIVKSTWFAFPKTFKMLRPIPDDNVMYSFHMYVPPHLTLHRNFHSQPPSYPGPVSCWISYPEETVEVTPEYLNQLLQSTVYSWQHEHQIPSYRILVAEFGICRETKGSQQYLSDLVLMFEKFGWSWLLFSFRDEEWDALDYELGPIKENMLNRTASELFMTVAAHFH